MTTLLELKQNKNMRGHISSTIQTSIPTTKANNQNGLLMGVYCIIRKTGWGTRIYVGATRDLWKRWQQHKSATRLWNKNYKPFSAHRNRRQMKKSCGRLGFFQVVSVNSSPMLHYTEQVAINTAKKISKKIDYKVLNKIDSCYLVTETNARIEKKLEDIIVRFENGERGFHLE
jgi:hypothetical protein